MENNQIVIPNGWTYYAHRTNLDRWENNPFEEDTIVIKKLMSVVTEKDIYQEVNHYGKNQIQGYSSGSEIPFEIRCLICDLSYLNSMPDCDIKNIMLKEFYYDRRNFGGAAGQRHHSIPRNEELVVLGIGSYDEVYDKEKNIIWTIPKRFIEFYQSELEKNQNRAIDLNCDNLKNKSR